MVLTPEQLDELEVSTENVSSKDPRPMIQLDVFHQLHCLDSIRKVAYGHYAWSLDDPAEQAHLGTFPNLPTIEAISDS